MTAGDHFERVAVVYESLRTTDEAPVRAIGQLLPGRPVTGLDIGCGTGRYTRLLRAALPGGSRLAASDVSAAMLAQLKAATQTFHHPRTSTTGRLRAQAEGQHYSTFSLYPPQELRAALATFLASLPSGEVSWIDEHLLVIAGRHGTQAQPDGPASPANQAITGQALQISAGRAGQAPPRR